MSSLFGNNISQTYQGLIKLADSTTGVTSTTQSLQDGLGNNIPIQVSNNTVNISGSLTVNGSPISVDTGSLVTTSSFNAYTSSVNIKLAGLDVETGSLQNQINQKLNTTSFNSYTSSNDSKVNSLIAATGSFVTETESGSFMITGSVSGDTLTFTKGNGTTFSLQVDTGSVGNLQQVLNNGAGASNFGGVGSGSIQLTNFTNDRTLYLNNNSFPTIKMEDNNNASNNLTIDLNTLTLDNVSYNWSDIVNNNNRNGLINTGSLGGSQSITGSLNVGGTLTATSASITYLETVYETASIIYSSGSNQLGDASNDTQTLFGTVNLPSGPLSVTGNTLLNGNVDITTGNLNVYSPLARFSGSQVIVTGSVDVSNGITGSLQGTASFATNAATASIANDLIVRGKNNNPSTLTRGTIVRIVGANGDNPLIDSASWTDDLNSANTLGMLSEDVSTNGFANVVVQGKVIGINTSGMNAGDLLYLSSSGQYTTSSVPSPFHEVRLGQVLRANVSNGSAYVSVDNGYELSELHDVDITNPVVGDLLVYRSGSYGQWVNETGVELGYATTGSNTFTGQQNIETNLNVTQSLIVGGNSTFNGQTDYNGNINYNADSFIKSGSQINFNIGDGLDGAYYRLSRKVNGEFGIVQDPGNYHLLDISSSFATFLPPTNFTSGAFVTGSLSVRSGSLSTISNNTTININNYLTSSLGGQSNIIKGWSDAPALAGPGSLQTNYTGSLRITGSNNIVSMPQIRATGVGGGTDQQGYISGSDNMILSNNAGIYLNTGSLLFPRLLGNIVGNGSAILMNFTTSSLAGNPPQVANNIVAGGNILINSNSGSMATVNSNAILGGNITSTQNFVTNTRPTIGSNNVIGAVTLNHISSSITYGQNYNNSPITINNHLSSSALVAGNTFTFISNAVIGGSNNTGLNVWISGSQSSQTTRQVANNLLGGSNIIVSSSFVSSSNSSLNSALVYGQGLGITGNHSGIIGGTAIVGRFNDTGSLGLAQDIVFAVGTGGGPAGRRTGFWIDSGSFTNVSGSLSVKGVTNALTVTGSANITHGIAGQSALTVVNSTGTGQPGLIVSGTTSLNGQTSVSGTLRVGTDNNTSVIQSLGGSQFLYRDGNNNTVVGNANGVGTGFVSGSEKNMIFNGFATPFNNGSNNVLIMGAGDNFISGSNNIFIGGHNGHAGGSGNILIGNTSYSSGSIFNDKFELGISGTRLFHKQGADPLQIGDDTQVTGSISISNVMNLKAQDPLPTGNIGDLAVSGSNLFFYNGAWTQIV